MSSYAQVSHLEQEDAGSNETEAQEVAYEFKLDSKNAVSSCSQLFDLTYSPILTADQARDFLTKENIEVWKVVCRKVTLAGVKVEFVLVGTMKRIDFYARYIVWFAVTLLGLGSGFTFSGVLSERSIESALQKFEGLSHSDILNIVHNHIFHLHNKAGMVLTYYAKDGMLDKSPVTKSMLFDTIKSCDKVADILKRDIVSQLGSYNGIAFHKAWVYSGGTTMAGHHVEDCYLKFVHACFDVKWSTFDWEWDFLKKSKKCPVTASSGQKILQVVNNMAVKSWLVGCDAGCAEGIVNINKIIAIEFGHDNINIEHALYTRCCILNPEYFTIKSPQQFREILLRPGQALLSDDSHSVYGFCSTSVAWNVLFPEDVARCLQLEKDMALSMQSQSSITRVLKQSHGRGETINTSLACELLRECDRSFDLQNDFSYAGTSLYATHQSLVDKLWCRVHQPALKLLCQLYLSSHTTVEWSSTRSVSSSTRVHDGNSVTCSGILSHKELGNTADPTLKQIKTGTVVCYVCGIPCLMDAVVASVKVPVDKKMSTCTRLLCRECFGIHRHFDDVVREAHYLCIRSGFDIWFREYPV